MVARKERDKPGKSETAMAHVTQVLFWVVWYNVGIDRDALEFHDARFPIADVVSSQPCFSDALAQLKTIEVTHVSGSNRD